MMEVDGSRWYSVMRSPIRRAMAATWCVLAVPFDFLLAQQFFPTNTPTIDGWATVLLTTETLGPVLAIVLFHLLTVVSVLAVPPLGSYQLVRVALTVSVMTAAFLTAVSAVASNGVSVIIIGATALAIAALRAALWLLVSRGPNDQRSRLTGVVGGASVLATALLLTGALPLMAVGAGTAISGLLVTIMLRETAAAPRRLDHASNRLDRSDQREQRVVGAAKS